MIRFALILAIIFASNGLYAQFKFDENVTVDLPEPHEVYTDYEGDMDLYQIMHFTEEGSLAIQRLTAEDEEEAFDGITTHKTLYMAALLGMMSEMSSEGYEFEDSTFTTYQGNYVLDVQLKNTYDQSITDFRIIELDHQLYSLMYSNPERDEAEKAAFYNSLKISPNVKQFTADNKINDNEKDKKIDAGELGFRVGYAMGIIIAIAAGLIALTTYLVRRNRNRPSNDF